jgi:hypothetical protein
MNMHLNLRLRIGLALTASVVGLADNKTVELTPNDLGLFARVLLRKEQAVAISLTYSDGEPGEVLVISASNPMGAGRCL